jgi:LysM repeat protein
VPGPANDPANDPAPDPNEPNALLHFPLRSDGDEPDSGASPDTVSAGGRGRTTTRLIWLAALVAIVVLGSAVAFLTDGAGGPALADEPATVAAADDAPNDAALASDAAATEQVQPASEPQPAAETEPAEADPETVPSAEPTAVPAEPDDPAAASSAGEEGDAAPQPTENTAEEAAETVSPPSAGVADWPRIAPYSVRVGDRTSRLAARFETTIEAIVALNGIDDAASLTIGDVILIPYGFPNTPDAVPHLRILDSDTLPLLWDAVAQWTTGPGDTLRALAVRFETTVPAIEGINGLDAGAALRIGQELVIAVGYIPPTFN